MIALESIMDLEQPFISAASGLIRVEKNFYIVADDENFMAIYDLEIKKGEVFLIFNDVLPEEKKLRKKLKKDFESLVYLPKRDEILIVPSGSTENRMIGALMNTNGKFLKSFDFESFYKSLLSSLPELNIEGAVVLDEDLILFQRGNGFLGQNALIKVNLNRLMDESSCEHQIVSVDLGSMEGVPLSFTDATLAGKNILFLSAAEASESTYLDGDFNGAVLGIIDTAGRILAQKSLQIDSKPEGICIDADRKHFYLVTDDDDRKKASKFFKGVIPEEWSSLLV